MAPLSRSRKSSDLGAARILQVYGPRLRWERLPERLKLTVQTASQLHSEGFTMVKIRVGLLSTRQISLIRYMQREQKSS